MSAQCPAVKLRSLSGSDSCHIPSVEGVRDSNPSTISVIYTGKGCVLYSPAETTWCFPVKHHIHPLHQAPIRKSAVSPFCYPRQSLCVWLCVFWLNVDMGFVNGGLKYYPLCWCDCGQLNKRTRDVQGTMTFGKLNILAGSNIFLICIVLMICFRII